MPQEEPQEKPEEEKEGEKKWKRVWIPRALFEEIVKLVEKHPKLGYTSATEVIREAIRDKIEELKRRAREEQGGSP